MSVHGRSIFQYYNEISENWIPIPVGDLVSVEYADRIYQPAQAEIIISNKNMNKALGTDADATAGVYSVEGGAISTPTFYRYQEIRLLHMPRPLIPVALVHDAHGTQAVFTLMANVLTSGDYVQIVNDESGIIPDDLYRVDTATTNTFTLFKRGTSTLSQTYATDLPGGGPTTTTLGGGGVNPIGTTITVGSTTGIEAGSHIKIDDEIILVTTVQSGTVLNPVVRERFDTTGTTHSASATVTKVDVAYLQYRSDQALYPYFYGKIDSLDVSYSDAVGKTIHIEASDYLRSLQTETITKSLQSSTATTAAFQDTRMIQANAEEDEDQGKFRDVKYDNVKLSTTVSAIMSDWSVGRDLYADNTTDGSTSLGVTKFEDSTFVFKSTDQDKTKTYKNTSTTALSAMRSVAMTDPHWNYGIERALPGYGAIEIYYGSSGSLVTTGSDKDVVLVFGGTGGVGDTAHKYVNGNLINITGHAPVGSPTPETIQDGTYIVHSKTTYDLKLKSLDGDVIQSTANVASSALSGTPSKINGKAAPSGNQGYDFYLDAGLYGDVTLTSNTHRPHLNYFMRKTRPIDPDLTGLTAVYPSDDNMEEDDPAFGTKGYNQTKIFILQDFDHGLFDEDLYSQVALQAVDSTGMAKNVNNLGHKMEMLKVNSISNSDYVFDLANGHQKYSGTRHGNGLFHWNRADDARAYGWYSAAGDIDDGTEVNIKNIQFFADSGGQNVDSGDFTSKGTFGVLAAGYGGFRRDTVTGMAGYSNLPRGGRSITQSPADPTAGTDTDDKAPDNFIDDNNISRAIVSPTGEYILDMGGEAVASANLIKDMYWCEKEGLLGTEVSGTHSGSGTITVTSSAHGLETGCLIKVTQIASSTSGTVYGVKVNASPDVPTTANTTTDLRDNGSYFRVEFVSVDTFKITVPQKHKDYYRSSSGAQTNALAFSGSPSTTTFRYKPVFNVFKDACRVQWQSGSSWTTKEDDTVFDSNLVKGAQHILISDVGLKDRPYRGVEVNALVSGFALPGDDFTSSALPHPVDFNVGSSEAGSYFGFTTVPFCLEADFQVTGSDVTLANVHRYGSDADDDVRILFKYGDYISETRFLYGDSESDSAGGDGTGLVGVVGRDRGDIDGGAIKSSKDVFKTVNCKILERFATKRSISKTYRLNFNETFEAPDAARSAAAAILKRVILPAQRTTFKVFGYPTVKLIGQGQSGTTANSLVPAQNFASYGGRAGMLLEQVKTADGIVADAVLVEALNATTDAVTADMNIDWGTDIFYRAFIHLRAGMSIRVNHPAAGVIGNHILTGIKYNERGGSSSAMLSTTGYDEAVVNLMHSNLAHARNTIRGTANNQTITITDEAGYAIMLKNIQFEEGTTSTHGPFYDPT